MLYFLAFAAGWLSAVLTCYAGLWFALRRGRTYTEALTRLWALLGVVRCRALAAVFLYDDTDKVPSHYCVERRDAADLERMRVALDAARRTVECHANPST